MLLRDLYRFKIKTYNISMRVLMLGWFGDNAASGGMEVHIREICKNMPKSVSILLAIPKQAAPKIKFDDMSNVEILRIPCRTNATDINGVIKNVAAFNKNIVKEIDKKQCSFDVVHSHDWLCVASAKELQKKFNKPWIHTVHSLEHIRAAEETNSKISKIEKTGVIGADKIITVSNHMKKEILKKYPVPAKKICVIRNFLSMLNSGKAGKEKNKGVKREKTVLFVGRLALQKGVETLISAFPEVIRAHRDTKLIIVGDGNLKKSLTVLAKINGIEKSVVFKGYVSEKMLDGFYRQASVFVSPSVFEPFGITVIDAVNYGVPIIATKNTGALEIFNKKSAEVVEPLDKDALSKKIIVLLDSKRKRALMSKSAKNDLQKADGWETISKKTAKAYASVSRTT